MIQKPFVIYSDFETLQVPLDDHNNGKTFFKPFNKLMKKILLKIGTGGDKTTIEKEHQVCGYFIRAVNNYSEVIFKNISVDCK